MRPPVLIVLLLVAGCAVVPPSQSTGDVASPLLQASWEAGPEPPLDGAEAMDEALAACTGPLLFGVAAGDLPSRFSFLLAIRP